MKHIIKNIVQSNTDTATAFNSVLLRLPAALIFTAHGAQKLFGAFGGYGLEGTAGWMESIGLTPGYLLALLAGSAEFFGGLALLLGLFVRPAALVLAFTMAVALFSVHAANGLFMANNGYEFALTMLAMSAALTATGGGKWSLDAWLAKKLA